MINVWFDWIAVVIWEPTVVILIIFFFLRFFFVLVLALDLFLSLALALAFNWGPLLQSLFNSQISQASRTWARLKLYISCWIGSSKDAHHFSRVKITYNSAKEHICTLKLANTFTNVFQKFFLCHHHCCHHQYIDSQDKKQMQKQHHHFQKDQDIFYSQVEFPNIYNTFITKS